MGERPVNPSSNETTGRLAVRRDGRAVVIADGSRRPVLAVSPDRLAASGAMHGDTVVARRLRRQKRLASGSTSSAPDDPPSGEVIRVLERANPTVVGTLRQSGRDRWVDPDDRRLPAVAVRGADLGASAGEKVVVAVATFPRPGRPEPAGSIVERLGTSGDPDAETLAIIRSYGLRETFPEEVLAEAERLPREVAPAEREGRLDLTGEVVFTIDDADARDLDDAVSLSRPDGPPAAGAARKGRSDKNPAAWRLGVHIADVARYVPPGSTLDKEARERGTSVYLVDRVLPMFPPRLSNGIASLHPGVDRLTLSVFMDVDAGGRVVAHELRRSVIRTVARLTYDEVAVVLEQGEGASGPALPVGVAGVLVEMGRLAACLRRRRMDRGSLDFDFPEEKAELDGQGHPVAIVRRPRNPATQLIEEFMILANETVADHLLWAGLPFISRAHEEPFHDDLVALREQLAPLGYRVPSDRRPRPADLQAILKAARGRPEEGVVQKALLRALPLAKYSVEPLGHFALASPNYLHFTSPIRRYPDLTVHRQLGAVLAGTARDADNRGLVPTAALAAANSRSERAAEKAEAETLRLARTELARACLGWVEEGEIVDVFDFGVFVRLANGVEGLVPARELGRTAPKLGGMMRVQVARVDMTKRHVDLLPA